MLDPEAHVDVVKQPWMSRRMNSEHCVHENSHGLRSAASEVLVLQA
jgi:hypothetical protein